MMKKFIVLFLTFSLLIISFTACSNTDESISETVSENDETNESDKGGKDADEEASGKSSIVGEWMGEVDMADMLNEMLESSLGEYTRYLELDSFEVDVIFVFDKDGNYAMSVDMDSFEDAMNDTLSVWEDGITEMFEDIIAASGQDIPVEEAIEAAYGMSLDAYLEQQASAILNPDQFTSDGTFRVKGNKLYMNGEKDDYYTIRLIDDALEFTDYTDDAPELFEMLLAGVEFERQ